MKSSVSYKKVKNKSLIETRQQVRENLCSLSMSHISKNEIIEDCGFDLSEVKIFLRLTPLDKMEFYFTTQRNHVRRLTAFSEYPILFNLLLYKKHEIFKKHYAQQKIIDEIFEKIDEGKKFSHLIERCTNLPEERIKGIFLKLVLPEKFHDYIRIIRHINPKQLPAQNAEYAWDLLGQPPKVIFVKGRGSRYQVELVKKRLCHLVILEGKEKAYIKVGFSYMSNNEIEYKEEEIDVRFINESFFKEKYYIDDQYDFDDFKQCFNSRKYRYITDIANYVSKRGGLSLKDPVEGYFDEALSFVNDFSAKLECKYRVDGSMSLGDKEHYQLEVLNNISHFGEKSDRIWKPLSQMSRQLEDNQFIDALFDFVNAAMAAQLYVLLHGEKLISEKEIESLNFNSIAKGIITYLLRNVSLSVLHAYSKHWHKEKTLIKLNEARSKSSKAWPGLIATTLNVPTSVVGKNGFTIEALDSAAKLQAVGRDQNHCVGTYSQYCESGVSTILVIKKDDRIQSTLEYGKNENGEGVLIGEDNSFYLKIEQHFASGNNPPSDDCKKIVDWFEGELKLGKYINNNYVNFLLSKIQVEYFQKFNLFQPADADSANALLRAYRDILQPLKSLKNAFNVLCESTFKDIIFYSTLIQLNDKKQRIDMASKYSERTSLGGFGYNSRLIKSGVCNREHLISLLGENFIKRGRYAALSSNLTVDVDQSILDKTDIFGNKSWMIAAKFDYVDYLKPALNKLISISLTAQILNILNTILEKGKKETVIELLKRIAPSLQEPLPRSCYESAKRSDDAEMVQLLLFYIPKIEKKPFDKPYYPDDPIITLKMLEVIFWQNKDLEAIGGIDILTVFARKKMLCYILKSLFLGEVLLKNSYKQLMSVALSFGDIEGVKYLLGSKKVDLNKKQEYGDDNKMLLIYKAIYFNNSFLEPVLRLLIENGADPKVSDRKVPNALFYAIYKKADAAIKPLLDSDIDLNKVYNKFGCALDYALKCSSVTFITALIADPRVDVNIKDSSGNSIFNVNNRENRAVSQAIAKGVKLRASYEAGRAETSMRRLKL